MDRSRHPGELNSVRFRPIDDLPAERVTAALATVAVIRVFGLVPFEPGSLAGRAIADLVAAGSAERGDW